MMLPHVVRYNSAEPAAREQYTTLAHTAGLDNGAARGVDALVDCLQSLYAATGLPATLDACDIPRDAIPRLAEGAARQWTAQFNPRPASAADFETLYAQAFGGAS